MRRINQQRYQKQKTSLYPKVISIGFFGGFIWSAIAAITGYFNFTTITPKSFILRSWLQTEWSDQWLGQIVSIFIISLLSVGFAYLYYLMLKKYNGVLPGIIVGIVLWFIVFWIMEPIFPNIQDFYLLDSDTIVTTVCLFVLYSVFISYSISFAYHQHLDEKQ